MDLMYVPIWESTQWCINDLTCTIINLDNPCNTDFTNYALEIKVIFQNDDKFDNDCRISTAETSYEHYKGPFGIITVDFTK